VSHRHGNVTVIVRVTVTETVTGNVMGDTGDDAGSQWVTLGEFARRLGISRAGVYGRIKRGTVESRRKGNRGFEVRWPPPDHRGVMGDGHGDDYGDGHGDRNAHDIPDVVELRVQIARLEERLAGADRLLAERDARIADLQRPFWRRWLG
jgi:hypothetical protein